MNFWSVIPKQPNFNHHRQAYAWRFYFKIMQMVMNFHPQSTHFALY